MPFGQPIPVTSSTNKAGPPVHNAIVTPYASLTASATSAPCQSNTNGSAPAGGSGSNSCSTAIPSMVRGTALIAAKVTHGGLEMSGQRRICFVCAENNSDGCHKCYWPYGTRRPTNFKLLRGHRIPQWPAVPI